MIVAIIPAKGGIDSFGIPGKNYSKPIGRQSLLERACESALIPGIDKVCITSDFPEQVTRHLESNPLFADVILLNRPDELAVDPVQVDEVILFSFRTLQDTFGADEIDTVVVLQPTSPFRTADHVEQALKLFQDMKLHKDSKTKVETLISVYETPGYQYSVNSVSQSGYWFDDDNPDERHQVSPLYHKPQLRLGRQDIDEKPIVTENGAIYIVDAKRLSQERSMRLKPFIPFYMSELESLEIDTEYDYNLANFILEGGYLENNS